MKTMSLNRCERGATRCLYGTTYYSTWESTCHYLHDSFKDVLISTWQCPCRQAAHWWSRGAVLRHASLAAPQSEGKKKKQVIITVDFKGRLFTIGNCAQHSLTTQTIRIHNCEFQEHRPRTYRGNRQEQTLWRSSVEPRLGHKTKTWYDVSQRE